MNILMKISYTVVWPRPVFVLQTLYVYRNTHFYHNITQTFLYTFNSKLHSHVRQRKDGGGENPNQKNIWFCNTNNLIRKKPTLIEGKNVYFDYTLSKKTLHSENFHLDLFQENIMLIFNLDKLWINISKFSVSFQT